MIAPYLLADAGVTATSDDELTLREIASGVYVAVEVAKSFLRSGTLGTHESSQNVEQHVLEGDAGMVGEGRNDTPGTNDVYGGLNQVLRQKLFL